MAKVLEPISDAELKKITVVNLRNEYKKLANFYQRIMNNELIYCSHCGQWKSATTFYASSTSPDGIEHYACKECILNECSDFDKKTGIRTDNKSKTIETFRRLNWYFDEKVYTDQMQSLSEQTGEKIRSTAVQQFIVMYKSLPNWKNLKFADSVFLDEETGEAVSTNKKPRKEIVRLFGNMPNEDLLYLQDQYDDWKSRVQIDTKPQETYLVQICLILLDIYKARMAGKDTDKLVRSLNDAMAASNLQPRQNVSNSSSDMLTFGQLIEKWETEDSIEPDPEFEDVDGIKKYINVFFKGHLAKMMGLKNAYSKEYDDYMAQYTVTKPTYDEDSESSDIYDALFGKEVE